MNDTRQIEDLFAELIQLDSDVERQRFLRRIESEDPQLRVELERLAEAHENAGSFLDGGSENLGETVDSSEAELVGRLIGPYKLLQRIGEGGMGTVFMAEQKTPVKRRVALKIIKAGMDSREILARFEAERQALAMMDHPNIAKVLEAATADGRPYFVMELVKGVAITEYADDHRLSTRERLELFVDVCQAVQHAHQKGIIHRDLKPSNILVAKFDDRPVVKVIDFGVAKATNQELTERTMFTQFGQVVGTLEYMSPEQAQFNQLDIDTRSDVYSLGVLLYELLTGQPPFDRRRLRTAALDEVIRIIREEDPPKPSTRLSTLGQESKGISEKRSTDPGGLGKAIRGDIDLIVMKSLEKDRSRRYETANGFAVDVRRYLDGEPIEARSPSSIYRLQRFAARNKGLVFSAASVVVAITIGLAASLFFLTRAIKAQRDTEMIVEEYRRERVKRAELAILNTDFELADELLHDVPQQGKLLDLTLKGIVDLFEGRMAEAIGHLKDAVEKDPEDVSAIAMLSVAEQLSDEWEVSDEHRRVALTMTPRPSRERLDRACQAHASIYSHDTQRVIQELGQLHERDKVPFVSDALANALAQDAYWFSEHSTEASKALGNLDRAEELVASIKSVTSGYYFLDLLDVFMRTTRMRRLKELGRPEWNVGEEVADVIAEGVLKGVSCPVAGKIVGDYYALCKDATHVERAYQRIAEMGGTRYQLLCLEASSGREVDWNELSKSPHKDDRLTAAAFLPHVEISHFTLENLPLQDVDLVIVHLMRREFSRASELAQAILNQERLGSDHDATPEKFRTFDRLFLRHLTEEDFSDEAFVREANWRTLAAFHVGLKHRARGNQNESMKWFRDIGPVAPPLSTVACGHWIQVLISQHEENESDANGI